MAMSRKRSGKRFAGRTLTKRLKRSNFAPAARVNPATRETLCQPSKVSFEQMFGYYFSAQPERFHSPHTSAYRRSVAVSGSPYLLGQTSTSDDV